MKPSRPRPLSALLLALAILPGCVPGHERQMIYTAPRGSTIRVEREGARTRPSRKPSPAPAPDPLPATNGVDVPIIQPE